MRNKLMIFLVLVAVVVTLTGCDLFGVTPELTLIVSESIEVGEVQFVEVKYNIKGEQPEYIYSSSDNSILEIDQEGYIEGILPGVVTIKVSLKNNKSVFVEQEITVVSNVIKSFEIVGPEEMYLSSTVKYSINANPTYASTRVTWEIEDGDDLASLDNDGNFEAHSVGVVTIKATSTLDTNVIATKEVTISASLPKEYKIEGSKKVLTGRIYDYKVKSNDIDLSNLFEFSVDSEIATISLEGTLLVTGYGEFTIRASYKEDSTIYKEIIVTTGDIDFMYEHTKILTIDRTRNYIELLGVEITKITNQTEILKLKEGLTSPGSLNDLYIGMENIYVKYSDKDDYIKTILIDGDLGFKNIRVGIRRSIVDISIDETKYHYSIDLELYSDTEIKTFDNSNTAVVSGDITIDVKNGFMRVMKGSNIYFETNKRIIIEPTNNLDGIHISSISRGSFRLYSGNLEVSLHTDKMIVVNDIDLESYLYKVVPSEMPAGYNAEALKAQAIAARTYAYRDIFYRGNESYGYVVDDSVQSQVYNNGNAHPNTTEAVNLTKGLVMMHGDDLVNAYYYATSSGLTGSAHEIWIDNNNITPSVIPYLIGQNHTTDENGNTIPFDYTSEANMLEFFKRINVNTYDNTIAQHRWRVTFSKEGLTQTLNINLNERYLSTPNLILTKQGSTFVSKPISNIGDVTNVYVEKRGTSGVVMELIIETTTNTYKIINQYNMRFLLRPQHANTSNYTRTATQNKYQESNQNSIMFSGFFAIEESSGEFVFYGGGNGHGVGMSQNGANTLGKSGKDYIFILNSYYSAIDLIDITFNYEKLDDFINYL